MWSAVFSPDKVKLVTKTVRGGGLANAFRSCSKIGSVLSKTAIFDNPSLKTAPSDVVTSDLLDSFVSSSRAEPKEAPFGVYVSPSVQVTETYNTATSFSTSSSPSSSPSAPASSSTSSSPSFS